MAEKKQKEPKKETKPAKPERATAPKGAARAENVVFVGRKPPMSYVLAVMTSFGDTSVKKVTLKARGQAITTAVDVAEIAKRRFIKDAKVGGIIIGTEEVSREQGGTRNVSTIEITIAKS